MSSATVVNTQEKNDFSNYVFHLWTSKTPPIKYLTELLKDLINDGVDGLICEKNTPENLADNITKLYENTDLFNTLQKNIWDKSKKYMWNSIPSLKID